MSSSDFCRFCTIWFVPLYLAIRSEFDEYVPKITFQYPEMASSKLPPTLAEFIFPDANEFKPLTEYAPYAARTESMR